jgi:AcrR family transcriptional regulator
MGTKKKTKARQRKRETTLVTGEPALHTLASPLRMEILQSFSSEDRITVADLARRLGRPRGSLYYHVRKLVEIGVLVEVDRRLVGRRYEAVYEAASERIAIGADATAASARRAAAKLVLSTLRQAGREFGAALETGLLDERMGFQVGSRQRARLTDEELTEIRTLLDRIEEICSRKATRTEGHWYAVTSLIVPLSLDRAPDVTP